MMEKHTIKAPSKRKYHRNGTLSKAEVILIHQTLILNVENRLFFILSLCEQGTPCSFSFTMPF